VHDAHLSARRLREDGAPGFLSSFYRRLLWGWGGLWLLFVLVLVATAAEDLLEDVFLLLRRLVGIGGVPVGWRVWLDSDDGRWGAGLLGVGDDVFVAAYAEDFLDKVLRALGHLAAGVLGRGAVKEGKV
jgi:hypothetical protein